MFKLPEQFRDKRYPHCDHGGAFKIPKKGEFRAMFVIASDGTDIEPIYEHVSVTLDVKPRKGKGISSKTPNWYEMCYVKSLFWDAIDTVIQLHVPQSDLINIHPGCLHLWRCPDHPVILPPIVTV